jgi:hypothetical protein
MRQFLILFGVLLVVLGLAWPWISKLPWGRLPGDISITRANFSFHFPLMTCLIISLVITLVLWLWRK